MINLLSTETKKELRAAKRNVVLRKYVTTLLSTAVMVASAYGIGYLVLTSQEQSYRQELAQYTPQKDDEYADTIALAAEYSKNLSIAKTILENEVVFSDYLVLLAKTTPSDVVLVNLATKSSALSKPVQLIFATKTYDDSLRVKEALEVSPYFFDAKIQSVEYNPVREYDYRGIFEVSFDKKAYVKARSEGTL